jgi:hypothetical protein
MMGPVASDDFLDRRAFIRSAALASFGLAAGATLPFRLAAQPSDEAARGLTGPSPRTQPDSNRRMAELLRKITREADPMRNPFRNHEQLVRLREMEAKMSDNAQLFATRKQIAWEMLDSGMPDDALAQFSVIERMMEGQQVPLWNRREADRLSFKAKCQLRIALNENCFPHHNADSCLFPIHGQGIHQMPRGARAAVATLTELLEKYPGDLCARWLLNIAYMMLGEHPGKVPSQWLLDQKLFASDYDIKRFVDVAPDVGLDVDDEAGGVVIEDFDNDGFLDVMVSAQALNDQLLSGRSGQLRLFHNNGDGTFTERTEEAGLLGLIGGLNMIQTDYNNDGLMDVLVLRGAWYATEGHYPCSLLRNNGDFTFTDVTEEAGLLRFHPVHSAVWFDYNGDGWLDLFIAYESRRDDRKPCELFRNNGDGTFTECAAEHGVDFVGFFKGVVSADFNNDGRPDLFLSRLDGPKLLLRNDGPAGADTSARAPWRFTNVAEIAGVTEPPISFPCWFWDYNNDGWPDIFVSGFRITDMGDIAAQYLGLPEAGQRPKLYRNNGDGTFTDVTKECGLDQVFPTMGANFGDLDNDGWLDFYLGTGNPDYDTLMPNRMFRNDRGQRFQDVTTSGGFGQLMKGHGIAFADLNNDGTQDVYSVVGGATEGDHYYNQLFANPGHGNNWLKLKLVGVKTNRAAIGARIRVVVENDEGERSIHRIVGSGGSFGASPIRQEIGLGRARAIKRVEVYWPVSNVTQVVTGLELDSFYRITEGLDVPVRIELRNFKWPAKVQA